jgi:predicted kinase
MSKIQPTKPFLLLFYGYPGSGKTYFARQFCENVEAAHLQADRIRLELFEHPRYDTQENKSINQIMNYMAGEFLTAGMSVAYDANALRAKQRRILYDLAKRNRAVPLLVWFQMNREVAFSRNVQRDRRRADDKYAAAIDRTSFEDLSGNMQNPSASEAYAVISGKHPFKMQQSAVMGKLREIGVLAHDDASSKVIKPGMVNLVPKNRNRYDVPRRNISVR